MRYTDFSRVVLKLYKTDGSLGLSVVNNVEALDEDNIFARD